LRALDIVRDGNSMELLAQVRPFPYLLVAGVLSAKDETAVLSQLNSLQWKDRTQDYYRFRVGADSEQLERVFDLPPIRAVISHIRQALSACMGRHLSAEARLTAQLYDDNTIIGFHNDHAGDREVRFVLNLNTGWSLSEGGIWVLSNKPDLSEAVFIPPLSNTGFAFETNTDSFHALTRRSRGLSYSLVASFAVL